MAKIATELLEEFPDILPDVNSLAKRWTWKEDTNSLELVSNAGMSYMDKGLSLITKSKKGRLGPHNGVFTEIHKGKTRDSVKLQSVYGSNIRYPRSPKSSARSRQIEDKAVTLDDVKNASVDLLSDQMELAKQFKEILSSLQLNDFLLMLLYYFEAFFNLRALENKAKPMATEPSAKEKAAMATQVEKRDRAKKVLAEKYSTLLLGLGMQEQHHMACGRQRKSHTKADRSLYEALYRFSVLVVWISFKRQEQKLIEQEVGRLFRSDTFNPNPNENEKEDFKFARELVHKREDELKLTPNLPLRKQRRPAITKIVNQRSPVIVSLLPTPEESSSWLLSRAGAGSRTAELLNSDSDKDSTPLDKLFPRIAPRVGIIGDSIVGYNPVTLAPFGEEPDETASLKRVNSEEPIMFQEVTGELSTGAVK